MRGYVWIALIGSLLWCTACNLPSGVASTFTAQEALDMLAQANLAVTDVEISATNPVVAPDTEVVEVALFQIPSDQGAATGNIFVFASAEQAARYAQLNQTAAFSTAQMTILVFTHQNLHVMLFGQISGERLEAYGTAIRSLR
jgi:hypothetical protein